MPEESSSPTTRKKIRWRRVFLWFFGSCIALLAVALLLLPKIAEKVIHGMIDDAGLEASSLDIQHIGWNKAQIGQISVGSDAWNFSAESIALHYRITDLLDGKIQSAKIHQSRLEIHQNPPSSTAPTTETPPHPPSDPISQTLPTWVNSIPNTLQQLGEIDVPQMQIVWHRNTHKISETLDFQLSSPNPNRSLAKLKTESFQLSLTLVEQSLDYTLQVSQPHQFLDLVGQAIDMDDPILPKGLQLTSADASGSAQLTKINTEPIQLRGIINGIHYDGGDQPVQLECTTASFLLAQSPDGNGQISLSGKLNKSHFPLDPSAGFILSQEPQTSPFWSASIQWGSAPTTLSAHLQDLNLQGNHNDHPLNFRHIEMSAFLRDGLLKLGGRFNHGGSTIPISYEHNLRDDPTNTERWDIDGQLNLGPISVKQSLPTLKAVSEVFEDIQFQGVVETQMKFSAGSHQTIQGKIITQIKAEQFDYGQIVSAKNLTGNWTLHLIPPEEGSGHDPSYYSFDFETSSLSIHSKNALDFDLIHQPETQKTVRIQGKGLIDDNLKLNGNIQHLHLHGKKDASEINFADTQLNFQLDGDTLTANGKTNLDGNPIPFQYRHERNSSVSETGQPAWFLRGTATIPPTQLSEALTSSAIFVEAMQGKTLIGKTGMSLNFQMGNSQDFDGTLTASIENGTLNLGGDDPIIIEGITAGLRLASLKDKHTARFSRVTAEKLDAFGINMRNLRLDYKLHKNGDISLTNLAVHALGGIVWTDPFIFPGDERDYKFKIRMKRLDVAQLAKLFPDFSGSISGRIDGLLPMASKNGDLSPLRGGMYLTPRTRGKLRYDAGNKLSGNLDPKSQKHQQMRMVERSLQNLELSVLSIRLFDPRDVDKAIVLRLQGQAPSVPGSPPIHLNINGFKPDDDTVNFFDLLLRHRDKLNFGL